MSLLCRNMLIPSSAFGRWQHSHEEDTNETEVYRPEDHSLPLSRGRKGFKIGKDGEFIELSIAPTDGINKTTGQWEVLKNNTLRIILGDGRSYKMDIVTADKDILEIKRK